jgi:hypothetical protein
MDAEQPDYWYTGVHTFVFMDHVPPDKNVRDVVKELRRRGPDPERGPVMFASEFVGPYIAFAHLRTEQEEGRDLAVVQELIAGTLWDLGVHCNYASEKQAATTSSGIKGAKRGSPGIIGLVRISVRAKKFDDVWEDVIALIEEDPERFRGASEVQGDFDILLQVSGETFNDAKDAAAQVRGVKGVADMDTAFADGSLYDE